jgi:hypothetical protein
MNLIDPVEGLQQVEALLESLSAQNRERRVAFERNIPSSRS